MFFSFCRGRFQRVQGYRIRGSIFFSQCICFLGQVEVRSGGEGFDLIVQRSGLEYLSRQEFYVRSVCRFVGFWRRVWEVVFDFRFSGLVGVFQRVICFWIRFGWQFSFVVFFGVRFLDFSRYTIMKAFFGGVWVLVKMELGFGWGFVCQYKVGWCYFLEMVQWKQRLFLEIGFWGVIWELSE